MIGGVGGTPQGEQFSFFPKPVVSKGEREHPRWITSCTVCHRFMQHLDNILFHFMHVLDKLKVGFHTVGVAARLCGLPVHGFLHGLLPSSEAELALCEDAHTRSHVIFVHNILKFTTGQQNNDNMLSHLHS